MTFPFLAVAVDFDGTLTSAGRPGRPVLDAIRETRAEGRWVLLVTGRILAELRDVYPDVADHFDLVVAENGAVLAGEDGVRDLVPSVAPELGGALAHRDVAVRRGRVLLACAARDASVVLEEIGRLELDCQLFRNRGELMVLPAGVTKGTGLIRGLTDLGISRHRTVAIGDAENDHHLLDVCELGVAVGNAVEALKRHADMVLDAPDGDGVAAFLRGPVLQGTSGLRTRRRQIEIGQLDDGRPALLPASQVNVLITGGSQSGKSYTAGLFAERLMARDYSVLVFDLEGDHVDLARLRGVLVVGATDVATPASALADVLRQHAGSLVVDLSSLDAEHQHGYLRAAAEGIERQRAATGLPDWIVADEAHVTDVWDGAGDRCGATASKGYCLVTYRPGGLDPRVLDDIDVMIATLGGGEERDQLPDTIASFSGLPRAEVVAHLADPGPGAALVIDRRHPARLKRCTIVGRRTPHIRHWHKYVDGTLPEPQRFYFHDGAVAANITEFHRHVRFCDPSVIDYHAGRGDFSRWISDVLQDRDLAARVHLIEQQLSAVGDGDAIRGEVVAAVGSRYLG